MKHLRTYEDRKFKYNVGDTVEINLFDKPDVMVIINVIPLTDNVGEF